MSEKKLYMVVTPSPDTNFDNWCYPVTTDINNQNSWKPVLEDIENSLEAGFMNNDEGLEGVELSIKFEMMLPSDIEDVSNS